MAINMHREWPALMGDNGMEWMMLSIPFSLIY